MSDLTETQRLTIRNEALVKLDGFEMDAAAATYLSHALSPVIAQMLADERERIAQHAEEMADAPLDAQLDRTTWRGALLAVASFARDTDSQGGTR